MDWLQEYDFSDDEIRSIVAGMKEMSAVDGDVDPQELELIQQVADGVDGVIELDFSVFQSSESKVHFLYLVTLVAIIDTTIKDAEVALLNQYIQSLGLAQDAQYFIDVVGEKFLKTVFADSEVLKVWVPRLKDDLRLSETIVDRLMA